jgi:hypothetical protein
MARKQKKVREMNRAYRPDVVELGILTAFRVRLMRHT